MRHDLAADKRAEKLRKKIHYHRWQIDRAKRAGNVGKFNYHSSFKQVTERELEEYLTQTEITR